MIVIVDSVSRFPDDTRSVAEFTVGMGIDVQAVGIGNQVTNEELLAIAGSQDKVYTTSSFSVLPAVDVGLSKININTSHYQLFLKNLSDQQFLQLKDK